MDVTSHSPAPARIPASPEAVALARELVARYPQCFWYWRPGAKVEDAEHVELVIENLRKHGNQETWREAARLRQCL